MARRRKIAVLTDHECDLLIAGREDPSLLTDYFFRQPGEEKGWIFDDNFDPEGAWQLDVHHAEQKRIVVIGGFGSGKTRGIGMSACAWSMTTMHFKFLNTAPKAWQSELMYNFIVQEMAEGTPFERLIHDKPKRPYPKITLKFMFRDILVTSTMEFMSIDKNASAILSWEGDWINIDEAGMSDNLDETIRNLGSRLRGVIRGRPRLGRMSMISNSWPNPELWYRYDLATELPESYLSITVDSRFNHNVTDEQLRFMLKDIPEDEHDQFISGKRPEGKGKYFSKQSVYQCESIALEEFIDTQVEAQLTLLEHADGIVPEKDRYIKESINLAGLIHHRLPVIPGNVYMLFGDPGSGNAPNRNAPVLLLWDVTKFPVYPAQLAAFWWGAGNGAITPFVAKLIQFMSYYNPVFTAVDSTGPQKGTAELINTYLMGSRVSNKNIDDWLGGVDISNIQQKDVKGMDFSSGYKPTYLVSARLMLESGLFTWPKSIKGIRAQLSNYEPEKDKVGMPKFPQDIVSAFAMSAFGIRVWFSIDPEDYIAGQRHQDSGQDTMAIVRNQRLAENARTQRSGRTSTS